MKEHEMKNGGKSFPFRHNLTSILFCSFALLLCAVGAGISVYRIILGGIKEPIDVLQSPLLIAVCLFCAAVMISVLIKSEYTVTDSELITSFGFIKSRLSLSAITSMVHDRTTHKLTVYCGEQFTVFTLKPEWADSLVHEMCQANPNIDFSFTLTENKPPKDNNDKKTKNNKKKN